MKRHIADARLRGLSAGNVTDIALHDPSAMYLVCIADKFNVDSRFVLGFQWPMLKGNRISCLQFGKSCLTAWNIFEWCYIGQLVIDKMISAIAEHFNHR